MTLRTETVAAEAMDLAKSILSAPNDDERTYKSDRDFATATDYAIEDAVRELLADRTPDLGFLGEERGHTGNREKYWCLDPIDGTTNFVRGIPNYGVSLALIEDGSPTFGSVALPAHHEDYRTVDGAAYLNGERLSVASIDRLADAVVAVGDFATGEQSAEKNRRRLAMIDALSGRVGRVRMLGSAATDLAWLAAGRLDAVVIDSNHSWDVSAGIAIARSAGSQVTGINGKDYSLESNDLLAASPGIQLELTSILSSAREEGRYDSSVDWERR